MKSIAAAMFFLLVFATPRAFAQVVVGDYSPVIVPYGSRGFCTDPGGCAGRQFFSLASGSEVNEIDVGLAASPNSGLVIDLQIEVISSASHTLVLSTDSILTISASENPQILKAATTFPQTWLAAGTYLMDAIGFVKSGCSDPVAYPTCGVEWVPNQPGSAQVGLVGQGVVIENGVPVITTPLSDYPGSNGTFAFDVVAPGITGPPVGPTLAQILHLVAGPITPAPGTPVEAQLGFLDMNGNAIGPTSMVTLNPGQTQSLDFNASQFVNQIGQRIEVRPVIRFLPSPAGAAPGPLSQLPASFQVLDAVTGLGTLLQSFGPDISSPSLAPQILAGGQTMRFNAIAGTSDSCFGQLSFADKNGNAIGPTMPLNLSSGTGTSLDLSANALGLTLSQRIEVQPTLILTSPPTAGPPLSSVCQASVEVFDNLTGRTRTYQSSSVSLPAMQ